MAKKNNYEKQNEILDIDFNDVTEERDVPAQGSTSATPAAEDVNLPTPNPEVTVPPVAEVPAQPPFHIQPINPGVPFDPALPPAQPISAAPSDTLARVERELALVKDELGHMRTKLNEVYTAARYSGLLS